MKCIELYGEVEDDCKLFDECEKHTNLNLCLMFIVFLHPKVTKQLTRGEIFFSLTKRRKMFV